MHPEILVKITQYLSLNDAIKAFSISILPLLREAGIRVHLVDPAEPFLEAIREYLDPRQVTSVRLSGDLMGPGHSFSSFGAFNQLMCLSLVNPGPPASLDLLLEKFPTVRVVSLWYDSELQFDIFAGFSSSPFNRITRLEIHCAGTSCDHSTFYLRRDCYPRNRSIETFLLDAGHYPLTSSRFCPLKDPSCFLNSAVEFIQSLVNVRRVRFITNQHQMETFLQIHQWEQLVSECRRLERVIIQLVDGGEFMREAENIEQQLRHFRPGLIFRIETV